ncbi:MAG: thermonuclease family protein, partial [Azonexus sp.]|nr:thermonuclease family protein [Azonexus sp.]
HRPLAKSRWARPESYGVARKRMGWFPALLVALPFAAFTAVLLWPVGGGGPEAAAAVGVRAGASPFDRERAQFSLCSGPVRITCIVDGDTIWYQGTKIRIADLDTPEVSNPACANEEMMGRRATRRLQTLLNAGPFSLEPNPEGRSEDRYGRSLMLVTRDGASLSEVLVREGLAEQWGGPKRVWC